MLTKSIHVRNETFSKYLKLFVIFFLSLFILAFEYMTNKILPEKDFIYVHNHEMFNGVISCVYPVPPPRLNPNFDKRSGEYIYESTELILDVVVRSPKYIPGLSGFRKNPKDVFRKKIKLPYPKDNFDKLLSNINNSFKNKIPFLENSLWAYLYILESGEVWKVYFRHKKDHEFERTIIESIEETKFIPSTLGGKPLKARAYIEIPISKLKNSL